MLTTQDAAKERGVCISQIQKMIKRGQLKAVKKSGVWDIDPRSLRALAGKAGRPRK